MELTVEEKAPFFFSANEARSSWSCFVRLKPVRPASARTVVVVGERGGPPVTQPVLASHKGKVNNTSGRLQLNMTLEYTFVQLVTGVLIDEDPGVSTLRSSTLPVMSHWSLC